MLRLVLPLLIKGDRLLLIGKQICLNVYNTTGISGAKIYLISINVCGEYG